MDNPATENGEMLDAMWLRGKVVAMLQRMIEPSVWGNEAHQGEMLRARRILRRMGEMPCTDRTLFEQRLASIHADATFLRGVIVHKALVD